MSDKNWREHWKDSSLATEFWVAVMDYTEAERGGRPVVTTAEQSQSALDLIEARMGDILAAVADDEITASKERVSSLEAALREARSMLKSCALDEPDDKLQASWDRGLAKIDLALRPAG